MVDVIIKNVPKGAEEEVKEVAVATIERFIKTRVANNLTKKYCVQETTEPVNK